MRMVMKQVMLGVICLMAIGVLASACSSSQSTEPVAPARADTVDEDHDNDHDDDHDSAEMREHGAHEHGAATLTIAWSGSDMQADLDSPAFNIVGFEYEPTSDSDKQVVADAFASLENDDLLGFNDDAECVVEEVAIISDWESASDHDNEDDHADDDHADDDHGDEEVHSDIEAAFTLTCANPEAIESLDLSALFERFPNFADLDVQWISDTVQSSAKATPDTPVVMLR